MNNVQKYIKKYKISLDNGALYEYNIRKSKIVKLFEVIMQTISDTIEKFLLDHFVNEELELSRNELADFFGCVPSQINYVISTRFTLDRGYVVDSQRGGGGFVKITRVPFDDNFRQIIFDKIGDKLDYHTARQLIDTLYQNKEINKDQYQCIISAIEPKALKTPIRVEDDIRAKILKNILTNIYKNK